MESFAISLSFFVVVTYLGICIFQWLKKDAEVSLKTLVVGFALGTVIISTILFWTSFLFGQLNALLILITLAGLFLVAILIKPLQRIRLPRLNRENLTLSMLYLFPIFYIVWTFSRLLSYENGAIVASWSTVWADWAAHLTYTTSFVYGNNFPPQLPIYSGHVFSYPFLVDFISSTLMVLGVDIVAAQTIPTLLFMIAGFILFTALIYTVSQDKRITFFATLLFFCNGGLGFIYKLQNPQITQLTNIGNNGIELMSFLTSQFVSQRGLTLAFPYTLVIFWLLWHIFKGDTRQRLFFLTGFLISLLPLVHVHSFLVCVGVAGFLFLKYPTKIKAWFLFATPMLLIALPTILYFFGHAGKSEFIRLQLGWLARDVPWLLFWVKNTGMTFVLSLLGFLIAPKRLKLISSPFWSLFIVANIFVFQPWDWDNTKLFLYWYIGASFLAAYVLNKIFAQRIFGKVVALLLLLVSIFSGLHDNLLLMPLKKNKIHFFSNEQQELAEKIRNLTSPRSIFLTADNHDNPIAALAGRTLVMGYPGWLWSYGIDYGKRADDIAKIKRGEPEVRELLEKYKIEYVLIGPIELNQDFNQQWFEENYSTIYKSDTYTIYDLSALKSGPL